MTRRRVFHLVHHELSHDTVKALEQMLEQARKGELIGLCYVAAFRGREYSADATGEFYHSPTFARGCVAALDDVLSAQVSNH